MIVRVRSVLMYLSPRTAHRTVGYLEEAAHRAYTDYLRAVDSGEREREIENVKKTTI